MAKTPTLGEAGLTWYRGLVQQQGVLRGTVQAARSLMELALDYRPSRRRLRYGDIDYDFDHGVNTSWAKPSLAIRLREVFTRGQYQPSEPELFHQILGALPLEHDKFTFLDLGSGKGRTLLMASEYPFRRIVGVEIIPELHAIAEQNIRRYRNEGQRCFSLETWLGDARAFEFPADPTVLYLFNPFPADILTTVLDHLHASLCAHPREMYVIYHNLVHEAVFRNAKYLAEVRRTEQYAIYRASCVH